MEKNILHLLKHVTNHFNKKVTYCFGQINRIIIQNICVLNIVQDGTKVFTASCDKTAKMWDLATNQFVQIAQVTILYKYER